MTFDGSDPDETVEVAAGQDYYVYPAPLPLDALLEGTTQLRAKAISGSGLASLGTASGVVGVDRTPPTVVLSFGGDLTRWGRTALSMLLTGIDQEHLSGMSPAAVGQDPEDGAHIRWRLNEEDEVVVPGSVASVVAGTDGHHTLGFRAVDVAGNESAEREVAFRIDRTAPVGAFRAADVRDPRALVADVSDETSGVDRGWIEFRRRGGGEFRRLESALRAGVLTARMPDESLASGEYDVRAVVLDVAGNRAVVDKRAGGRPMTLALPLRARATFEAGVARVPRGRCGRRARETGGACKVKPRRTVTVGHGQALAVEGVLRQGGLPLARTILLVEAQIDGNGPVLPLGTTLTDERGRFKRVVPAGPSRTVRVRFAGDSAVLPAAVQVVARTRAATTLKVDRRHLLNGQAVRFAGRLLGRPLPRAGKLVALQARVPGGWRTFATPRADARGRFSHRYRFTSTTGLRRYLFRALVEREPSYPYERGVSRRVAVVVRGR